MLDVERCGFTYSVLDMTYTLNEGMSRARRADRAVRDLKSALERFAKGRGRHQGANAATIVLLRRRAGEAAYP
jgi:hypothetical protein